MFAIMIFANLAFALVLVASVGVDRLTRARVEWQTGLLECLSIVYR